MSNRWEQLPPSAQEQELLKSLTTTTTPLAAVTSSLRRNVGELIRQEVADPDQIVCYYRNMTNGNPIPYICELGCCPNGCCAVEEMVRSTASFGWAVTLFVVFVAAVVVVLITLLLLYLLNRHNDRRLRDHMGDSSAHSSTVSQISGPSYYPQDAYYPYATNMKTY
uniref:CX domain-containing protein n=1 Tax=Steinernema glaseri TaxID=37863 RepID=A0A1I8ANC2_9BILA